MTPAEIAHLQAQLKRDSAELDRIFDKLMAEDQMLADAKLAVLNSKSYALAKDIARIAGFSLPLDEWKRDKLIFAFEHAGVDHFPIYAFDQDNAWKPYPAMAEILAVFASEKSGWGCAFWFEGVNGYLRGLAPKDVISTDPGRVVEAATLEMQPVTHA